MTNNSFPFRRRSLVLALTLATGSAQAANISVHGNCTLEAAINNANTDTDNDGAGVGCQAGHGADTLTLNANTTYTLIKAAQDKNGLPKINSTITINGNGSKITRSGAAGIPYFRLLQVTAAGNLTLNKLTLAGGRPQGGNGGGILNNGNTVLNHCVVSGNSIEVVSGVGSAGGGVSNSGNMTLNNCTVSGNSALASGGIENSGNMTLSNSAVSGNISVFNGSISNSSEMRLTNSTISKNHSSLFGGTIANGGNMTITGSTISRNGGSVGGGGYVSNTGTLTINNSIISYNINPESNGGGIWNGVIGTVIVTNSFISNNTAISGGGISNHGVMTLSNNLISSNKAYRPYQVYDACEGGGGVLNIGRMTLTNNAISSNSSNRCSGGGIYNRGIATLTNSTISGNSSGGPVGSGFSGGGIFNYGTMVLSHSTVSGNKSVGDGGGIKNRLELTLSNSLIANNPLGGDCSSQYAPLTLQGANLIEDGSCGASLKGDPKLAPLLNNGGLTPTHALAINSPAVNSAVKSLCASIDQRHVIRPASASANQCDIGAFERMKEIPSNVATIVAFFDQQSANGGLIGTGKFNVMSRLEALRNQLLVAGNYKSRKKAVDACIQLAQSFKQIDPDNRPDSNDLVTGSAAGQLADQVTGLQADWLCK